MHKYIPLLSIIYLSACPASSLRGAIATAQSENHTLNTTHKCTQSAETLRLADLALLIILQELEKDKVITDYAAAVAQLRGHLLVCQIPVPEACCMGPGNCAPPYHPSGSRAARKAGCTIYEAMWVSRTWPPVCRPDWPHEPHCDAPDPYDWEATLVHELINICVSMLGGIVQPDYKHKIWESNGTAARIHAAYKAVRQITK